MAVLKHVFFAITLVSSVARCAPIQLGKRQTSAGVPDYVLKYGEWSYVEAMRLLPAAILLFPKLDSAT